MAEIKTWRERLDTDKWPNVAMQSEIDELRAALAAERVSPKLLEALRGAWLWMENQADSQSKGGHATFDLLMLQEQRDIAAAAIEAAHNITAATEEKTCSANQN